MHCFEGPDWLHLKRGRESFTRGLLVKPDPQGRCAGVLVYGLRMIILKAAEVSFSFHTEVSFSFHAALLVECLESLTTGGAVQDCVLSSYVDSLRDLDMKHVKDFIFLHGYIEPLMVILHARELTMAGRVSWKHHTCMISALSISSTLKQHPLIWSGANLPHDTYKLLAVPSPIGGVLVLSANTVHHYSQSASCMLALNNFAVSIGSSLKEELTATILQLEEMQKRKCDRRNQVVDVREPIQQISSEMQCSSRYTLASAVLDETDFSLRMLEESQRELQALQKDKEIMSDQLKHVLDLLNTLNSLCSVLGIDFKQRANEVHPSLGYDCEGLKIPSKDFIEQLETIIQRLREFQDLATSLLELWNLMDTPSEEQQKFQNVTCSAVEIAIEAVESGELDPACVLEQIELQIGNAKEEAFSSKSRIEIVDTVEKWLAACEEECWLEEYNMDENRYNAGRGTHLNLKRAKKLPAYALASLSYIVILIICCVVKGMAEALASKTSSWENERGVEFTYDGIRLLSMIEEYNSLRQEKEQER
ncbi:hypothetical protein RHSIM_RhsimUnG0154200 [Rhododendron simsii]|uniref:Uncharacterized protein n=1 Tax=Rhododendron simsii TaxID=118357 RepID=A0A834FWM1_RHOSS|nr:hypothetical protein RHSIM_RhsimUnG0154200 [Rhododendron simsii]